MHSTLLTQRDGFFPPKYNMKQLLNSFKKKNGQVTNHLIMMSP